MKKYLIYDGGIRKLHGWESFFACFLYHFVSMHKNEKEKVYGVKFTHDWAGRKVKVNYKEI